MPGGQIQSEAKGSKSATPAWTGWTVQIWLPLFSLNENRGSLTDWSGRKSALFAASRIEKKNYREGGFCVPEKELKILMQQSGEFLLAWKDETMFILCSYSRRDGMIK